MVVVKKLSAQLKIQLVVKLADAFKNVFGLQLQIFFVIKARFCHFIYSYNYYFNLYYNARRRSLQQIFLYYIKKITKKTGSMKKPMRLYFADSKSEESAGRLIRCCF